MVLMKYQWSTPPLPPKKGIHVERPNKLKSLSHNLNVPEECFDDFEIELVRMVEFLKRYTLVDHGLAVEENNISYKKIRENI